jgi:tRNA pseudouridine13 synthase
LAALTAEDKLPYLTADLPGIGGRIKEDLADFRVEELPLYLPSGQGTHVYFRVTKSGVASPEAAGRIARYLGIPPHEIGLAGLKDARAITTQMMSLEHVDPARLSAFRDEQVHIEVVALHTNKLRPGHLKGNRFDILIRGVGAAQLPAARAVLDVLIARGVPNYFGEQRFGSRNDTAILGEAMVRNELEEFIAIFLGRPRADDPPDCKAARDAFDAGQFQRALKRWPWQYQNERKALSAYKKKLRPGAAMVAIDKRMKRLYVSAFQSLIFNEMVTERLATIDRVQAGDLAEKADNGAIFAVEDPVVEQPRAERFEISPTGLVVGFRSNLAAGEPGRIEADVLARHRITGDDFRHVGTLSPKGTRRALRFRLQNPELSAGTDDRGEYLRLTFTAASGSYATVALREIMKSE